MFDILEGHFWAGVELGEYDGLVGVDEEGVLLLGVEGSDFNCAVLVEPGEVSVLVLVFVELLKLSSALTHFLRNLQGKRILLRPVTISEYFCLEVDISNLSLLVSLLEVLHQVLAQVHVHKHLRYLVHRVMPTLHLQLLQHQLLRILRQTSLLQQPIRQKPCIRLNKYVPPVQALKQPNYGIHPLLDLPLIQPLQPLPLVIVAIPSYELRGLPKLIHKRLKTHISSLLKPNVVLKTLLNHQIHLRLQVKQLLSKLNGILAQGLIRNYLLTPTLNVRLHLQNYKLQSGVHPLHYPKHQSQLLQFAMVKHLITTSVLLNKVGSMNINYLLLDYV